MPPKQRTDDDLDDQEDLLDGQSDLDDAPAPVVGKKRKAGRADTSVDALSDDDDAGAASAAPAGDEAAEAARKARKKVKFQALKAAKKARVEAEQAAAVALGERLVAGAAGVQAGDAAEGVEEEAAAGAMPAKSPAASQGAAVAAAAAARGVEISAMSPAEQASWLQALYVAVVGPKLHALQRADCFRSPLVAPCFLRAPVAPYPAGRAPPVKRLLTLQDARRAPDLVKALLPSWRQDLAFSPTRPAGAPVVLLITHSADRAWDFTEALKTLDCPVAMLYARHLKVDAQAQLLREPVPLAVGTPNRLMKLADMGALSLAAVSVVILDSSRNAKGASMFDQLDLRTDLLQFYHEHLRVHVTLGAAAAAGEKNAPTSLSGRRPPAKLCFC